MPRLFVDCDDTLVLWPTNTDRPSYAELYRGDQYTLNHALISNIDCWASEHPEYEVVVWSGGGVDYAEMWALKCFPGRNWSIAPKDMRWPVDADICIDDMYGELTPRDKRVRVLPPSTSKCPICS